VSIIRKIIKLGGEVEKVCYYFPPEDMDNFNKYELDEAGYQPDGTICEACLRKPQHIDRNVCEIDVHYMDIIYQLQDAGLLPDDYPLMCCSCFKEYQMIERLKHPGNR